MDLPSMTKEQIQERLKTLITERTQVHINLLAYDGAIQDCNYWLTQLDISAPTETETPSA